MTGSNSYRSTRSSSSELLSFEDVVMTGLAKDGGLFVPSKIPSISQETLQKWSKLSFEGLAFEIMSRYISEDEIPGEDLKKLVVASYSTFRSEEITPTIPLDEKKGLYLLELFHGPTYAFKDVALQFVGNLFEYFLQKRNSKLDNQNERETITVVGATSGDTGSAAIYGLRGKKDVSVFILYPTGRISPIQEEQMTTVEDPNVHTISVKGTFDDCQDLVKQVFADEEFNKEYHVGAVNSINWARILAQMTYYFYSYFQLMKSVGDESSKVRFVVPSGNFGDILAGYFAKEMGLPIDKLIIATNENDILDRFMKSGRYEKFSQNSEVKEVKATYSPAMDILISSNFERLLWYLVRDYTKDDQKAGETINTWMQQLKTSGTVIVPEEVVKLARSSFDSERVTDQETSVTIKEIYVSSKDKYVLDPHSSVGVTTSYRFIDRDTKNGNKNVKYISLSTAHPAKFAEVVNQSLKGIEGYSFENDVLPDELKALSKKEKRIKLLEDPSLKNIEAIIIDELKKEKA